MSPSRRRSTAVVVIAVAFAATFAACTNPDAPNRLERIDGPAQVDPDFGGLDNGTVVEVDDGSNESESGG